MSGISLTVRATYREGGFEVCTSTTRAIVGLLGLSRTANTLFSTRNKPLCHIFLRRNFSGRLIGPDVD